MTIPENVFIKQAKYNGDYRIAFLFTDGHSAEVDFHGFLSAPGQNPMVTGFLDVTRFKKFKIEDRADIVWGDWEMCFPFAALYVGDLGVDSLGNRSISPKRPAVRKGARRLGASLSSSIAKSATTKRSARRTKAK